MNGALALPTLRLLGLTPADPQLQPPSIMLAYVEARLRLSAARLYEQLKQQFPTLKDSSLISDWRCCCILDSVALDASVPDSVSESILMGGDDGSSSRSLAMQSLQHPNTPDRPLSAKSSSGQVDELSVKDSPNIFLQLRRLSSRQMPVEWAGLSSTPHSTRFRPLNEQIDQDHENSGWGASSTTFPEPDHCNDTHEQLIEQFRTVFLQVVRLSYLQQISCGSLPRGSSAALTLLASVDHALETAHTPGLQDFDFLKASLCKSYAELVMERVCGWIAVSIGIDEGRDEPGGEASAGRNAAPVSYALACTRWALRRARSARQADEFHALSSFIESHEFAQLKTPSYLGPDEYINSSEEALLVAESRELVDHARKIMAESYSAEALARVVSMKAVSVILHAQAEMIVHFHKEGILSTADAGYLQGQVEADLAKFRKVSL